MKPSGIAEVRRVRNSGGSSKLDPTRHPTTPGSSGGRRRSPFHRTSPTSSLPSSSFFLSQAHFFVIEFTLLSFFRHLLIGFSRRRGFPPILLLCFFVGYGDESQAPLCLQFLASPRNISFPGNHLDFYFINRLSCHCHASYLV